MTVSEKTTCLTILQQLQNTFFSTSDIIACAVLSLMNLSECGTTKMSLLDDWLPDPIQKYDN